MARPALTQRTAVTVAPPTTDETVEVHAEAEPVDVYTETSAQMQHTSDVKRMEKHFAAQPREKVRIPRGSGEQIVQINGWGFRIQPGVDVYVPEQVADVLRDADII